MIKAARSRKLNPLKVLSTEEVEQIHQATMRILGEVGIVLTDAKAREILSGSGAVVEGERVILPPDLVEREVARCPSRVMVRSREGHEKVLGGGSLSWHNLGGARDVIDVQGGRHAAGIQDVIDSTRLLDALSSVTTITPLFTPRDVPGEVMSLAMYRHTLPHTTKPVQGPGLQTAAEVRFAARMASVLGPAPEVLTLSVSPISPLNFPDDVAQAIVEIAALGVPFGPLPCPIGGATAPMSIAGSLAQQNAESLACVVLAQLVRPGLPIIYCGRHSMMEPRSGLAVWGGVELGLASAATVQIGHRYGLPVNVYGFSTNAFAVDVQSGLERAINAAVPALAGADELSGIGELQAGVAGSLAQMVCDDEMASNINRLLQGFAVDDDALAVDVIAAVMRGAGNFLGEKHTVRFMRGGEIHLTRLAVRQGAEESGGAGMLARAQAEAKRLLAEHSAPPLTDEQEQELDEILAEAESELVSA
jgi:trimethylamine--corrinoid protein Co-methyltransferase